MRNYAIMFAMLLVLPFVLAACATMSKEECVAADWRVIGETDGATGKDPQSRFAAHAKSCEKAGVVPDQTAWYQGFQQGVIRYCTPLNGLTTGKAGRTYNNICPADLSEGFLRGYNIGKAENRQRRKVQSLERQISNLEGDVAKLRKALGQGKIDEREAKSEIRKTNREIDRLRYEKQSEELDLRTIERDGEIFAANPDMTIPPRYAY